MTKVVVLEKFKKNWEIGSVVSVKDGYARNYLIPNGKAKFATKQNIDEIKLIQGSLLKKDDENKPTSSSMRTSPALIEFLTLRSSGPFGRRVSFLFLVLYSKQKKTVQRFA